MTVPHLRGNFVVLPLLSALTICLIAMAAEGIARRIFGTSNANTLGCMIVYDPQTGTRARANCVCYQKIRESPLVEYRFNNRGHRAGRDLLPKAKGTCRIVLIGSSMVEGLRVPWPQTFAALLPAALSAKTGKNMEVYDEGLEYGTPRHIDLNFQQVLDAQPDMILWAITKWDIENVDQIEPPPPSFREKVGRMTALFSKEALADAMRESLDHITSSFEERSAGLFLLEHYIFTDRDEFLKHYLAGPGTDFLKSEPSKLWKKQLGQFDAFAGEIARKSHQAGSPLVAVVIPPRAEAAMIAEGSWPSGYDPYRFGRDIRTAVAKNGGKYVDLLSGYGDEADADPGYYPVDGHPNARGHAILAKLLLRGLCSVGL